jgi:hypothetical protein
MRAAALPASSDQYWEWVLQQGTVNGPIARWISARHASTIRTWLQLREAGFECDLVDEPPDEGIVVTHTDFLPRAGKDTDPPWKRPGKFERWMASAFVVCFQADRPRHPYAHMHVVQNGMDATRSNQRIAGRRAGLHVHYIPLWPQPGLQHRSDKRGERFTNVGYFGIPGELDPSLQDPVWHERLRDEGLEFTIVPPEGWSDYRDIDAVVAVRSFSYPGEWLLKPASKLLNAWNAGVPAVLGRESAYRAERRSELDFLEVSSRDQVQAALLRLRDDAILRKAMVENGRRRASEFSDDAITAGWRGFLENQAIPAYERWRKASLVSRAASMVRRSAYVRLDAVVEPLHATRGTVRELWRHRGDWR